MKCIEFRSVYMGMLTVWEAEITVITSAVMSTGRHGAGYGLLAYMERLFQLG